jgi:glycosyltransferase involved in cell wall biosynthesis
MPSKKILVISPIPSHPQDAGNKARIYNLLLNLREMGHDLYFVHIQQAPGDEVSMQKCWGEKFFYSIPYKKPKTANKKHLQRLDQKIIRKVQSFFCSNPLYTYSIDDWYDDSINETLINLSKKIEPDIVIVEYVFFSKALECFDDNVVKFIDTHDIFADRYKVYQKKQQSPQWYSTTKKQENKGLNRADIVLAIQEKEAEVLSKRLRNTKVLTVGHFLELHQDHSPKTNNNILFVGSKNPINVHGINYFVQTIFPQIKAQFPDLQLILAGDICDKVDSFDGCLKLGRVANLKDAYDLVKLVISPVFFGTGLKIKNIEALGYSKALVTTSVGAEGLETAANKAFLIANSPTEFVNSITEIFSNTELSEKLSRNAYNFARQWNQHYIQVLNKTFNSQSNIHTSIDEKLN